MQTSMMLTIFKFTSIRTCSCVTRKKRSVVYCIFSYLQPKVPNSNPAKPKFFFITLEKYVWFEVSWTPSNLFIDFDRQK